MDPGSDSDSDNEGRRSSVPNGELTVTADVHTSLKKNRTVVFVISGKDLKHDVRTPSVDKAKAMHAIDSLLVDTLKESGKAESSSPQIKDQQTTLVPLSDRSSVSSKSDVSLQRFDVFGDSDHSDVEHTEKTKKTKKVSFS